MHPALFQKDLERVADAFNDSQKGRENACQLKLQLQMMTHMLCMRAALQYAVDNF